MNVADGSAPARAAGRGRSWWVAVPLVGFLALAGLFLIRLGGGDPSLVPSALIGRPVPEFALPQIGGGDAPGLASADLASGVHVVNVWASWCAPCRQEHPILMRLAADPRVHVVGINYKDVAENARRFLAVLGNPYAAIGADGRGATAIDWGVYGVPETFIVKDGTIAYKFIGPLSEETFAADFAPALEKALGSGGG